jgi:hypothetical protein
MFCYVLLCKFSYVLLCFVMFCVLLCKFSYVLLRFVMFCSYIVPHQVSVVPNIVEPNVRCEQLIFLVHIDYLKKNINQKRKFKSTQRVTVAHLHFKYD